MTRGREKLDKKGEKRERVSRKWNKKVSKTGTNRELSRYSDKNLGTFFLGSEQTGHHIQIHLLA